MSRSSHQRCSLRKDVLRNFAKFKDKHLCLSLFFNSNFIKKESLAQIFFCEFCEISKNTFFTEHLWATAFECLRSRGQTINRNSRPEVFCKKGVLGNFANFVHRTPLVAASESKFYHYPINQNYTGINFPSTSYNQFQESVLF